MIFLGISLYSNVQTVRGIQLGIITSRVVLHFQAQKTGLVNSNNIPIRQAVLMSADLKQPTRSHQISSLNP
jgi:hypothetical protein